MAAKIVIELETVKGAIYLKEAIEKAFPLLDGGAVKIITPAAEANLDEILKDYK